MEEVWKDIKNYEGLYQVSNLGRIRNSNHIILKQYKNHKGYLITQLSKKGKHCTIIVHRIVAKAFIPNLDNKPQINHINCNKVDNRVENLEWVTNDENKLHAKQHNLCKSLKGGENPRAKKVNQYDLNGNLIKQWDCINDITRNFKIKTGSNISLCCKYKNLTAYGYIWRYSEE